MEIRICALLLLLPLMAGCAGSSGLDEVGRTVLAEDQYYTISFNAKRTVDLSIQVEVHSGPNLDVFVVDEINFQQFKARNNFVHFESCGGVAAQGFQRSCSLAEGAYFVILDNTNSGAVSPPFNGIDDGADVSWVVKGA